jgi:thiol-disulfide isomerase/thioredoxin
LSADTKFTSRNLLERRKMSTYSTRALLKVPLCRKVSNLLAVIAVASFHLVHVTAREADERSKFLYVHNTAARDVIWDYEPHMHAPHFVIEDRSEAHADFANRIAQMNATETAVQPFFLREDYPIPRVVEFYSPWCGACQTFVPRYIAVAREVLNRLPPYHLEFYAVSCSEHQQLCHSESIRGYPTTRAFKAYSQEYVDLHSFTVQSIDDALELDLKHKSVADADGKALPIGDESKDEELLPSEDQNIRTLDILGATTDGYRHTRTDVYRDAALSFTYALENYIYEGGQVKLLPEQARALSEWFDLLYWTLPPTWMLHALINDLRRNIDDVVNSKSRLLEIVKSHHGVVHERKHMQWSQGCRNGEGVVASFSCGLWCLFHIVSVGVPERHASVLGQRHRVSTQHAADTLMDYMRYFFNWCPQCREQALQLHNSCAFNSCRRFRQRHKQSQKRPPESSWAEFPIWVWQFHNSINEKLMAKEASKLYGRKPSKAEIHLSRWPPKDACFLCYRDNGSWNQHHVLKYLKEEYWPAGVTNFRFVVLDKKPARKPRRYWYTATQEYFYDIMYFITPKSPYAAMSIGTAIIAGISSYFALAATRKRLRLRTIRRTGRHKKYDVGALFDVDA